MELCTGHGLLIVSDCEGDALNVHTQDIYLIMIEILYCSDVIQRGSLCGFRNTSQIEDRMRMEPLS